VASTTHPALDPEALAGRDLVERGLITREQLDEAIAAAAARGRPLREELVERGFVPAEAPAAPPRRRRVDRLPARFGKFELREAVGRGGMGRVYRAWQEDLRRTVAIKVVEIVEGGSSRSMTDRERFDLIAEARAAGRLAHPSIVQIHEVGRIDGEDYICMEYIEGVSLRDYLRLLWLTPSFGRRYVRKRRASLLKHVGEVAGALAYAHAEGVMHRDLKPGNILVRFDEAVVEEQGPPEIACLKLADFGLAIDLEQQERFGNPFEVIGTPGYLSPEQARGKGFRWLPATDVFSLGVVAYELLTGVSPFLRATAADSIRAVLEGPPPPPSRHNPDLPPAVDAVVMGCLLKEPWERYPTGEAVREAIEALLRGDPVDSPAAQAPRPAAPALSGAEPARSVESYLTRGRDRIESGDLGGALADLSRVLEKLPDHAEARMARGVVFFALGDSQRAIEDWTALLEQDPSWAEARLRRALALRWEGRREEALADYRRALQEAPPEWDGRGAAERAVAKLTSARA
jgi:serine/threonine-protein kinase